MQEQLAGLTARVRAFQCSGEGKRALLEELGTYVYAYPRRKYPHLEEDVAGEFYLFCHAKLERLITRFCDQGKPFERYVNSVLSWQLRSFLARRHCREQAWAVGLRSQLWDPQQAAAEPSPTPVAATAPPTATPPARAAASGRHPGPGLPAAPHRRRLIYAVLKAGHELDDRVVSAAAHAARCNEHWLRAQVDRLHRQRAPVQHRLTLLRERRNGAFAQLQLWQANAHQELDPERRARAAARASRLRRTVTGTQERLARVRAAPSNREIGAALGVPKGTVDTGLYWLKRQITTRYPAVDGVGVRQQQSA